MFEHLRLLHIIFWSSISQMTDLDISMDFQGVQWDKQFGVFGPYLF